MKIKRALIIIGSFLLAVLAGCGQGKQDLTEQQEKPEGSPIVVGFSQVGAESEWRVANTESIKRALSEENGYELIFDDARNEQENQIRAIRTFIQQDVDYIVFSPRVIIWHKMGASTRNKKYMYNYLIFKNQFFFAYKNFDKDGIVSKMAGRERDLIDNKISFSMLDDIISSVSSKILLYQFYFIDFG